MIDLIPKISELWKNQREKVFESADRVINFLKLSSAIESGGELNESILNTAYNQLKDRFDGVYGGFGAAPKFPSPHNLIFLLGYRQSTGENHALGMVEKTLHKMRLGGIFDHVGFGFHRYSTDSNWLLPHFEKMLYDQAMLAMAYVSAFQATHKEEYKSTACEIFTYVLKDMTSSEGGFYSAEDADSEGEEGLFYLWTNKQMREILGNEDGDLFIKLFNVEAGGNYFDEATGKKTGLSILHLKKSFEQLAKEHKLSEDQIITRWENSRRRLFECREKRIHPMKDDKILTDWNGLMIVALAKGSAVLDKKKYAEAACKAADFILEKLCDKKGFLLKRYRQGQAILPAHFDDYAFMVLGLIELYEATFEVRYLQKAIYLNDKMLELFWDDQKGGSFLFFKQS